MKKTGGRHNGFLFSSASLSRDGLSHAGNCGASRESSNFTQDASKLNPSALPNVLLRLDYHVSFRAQLLRLHHNFQLLLEFEFF
jgi:hypothetical protein